MCYNTLIVTQNLSIAKMSYHTPSSPCQATLEIKKSEFIAHAYPIYEREEIMFHVEQLKKQYPDARHICTAYILGNPNNTTAAGFDDDGEPNGTAGKPMLNVLQHKMIGNCLVAVVRYFGGIKLGAGGLTRAYSSVTQLVVDNMTLVPFIPKSTIYIKTDFANEAQVRYLIGQAQGKILDSQYGDKVILSAELDDKKITSFTKALGIIGEILTN